MGLQYVLLRRKSWRFSVAAPALCYRMEEGLPTKGGAAGLGYELRSAWTSLEITRGTTNKCGALAHEFLAFAAERPGNSTISREASRRGDSEPIATHRSTLRDLAAIHHS